jgi:hypothetical protein
MLVFAKWRLQISNILRSSVAQPFLCKLTIGK